VTKLGRLIAAAGTSQLHLTGEFPGADAVSSNECLHYIGLSPTGSHVAVRFEGVQGSPPAHFKLEGQVLFPVSKEVWQEWVRSDPTARPAPEGEPMSPEMADALRIPELEPQPPICSVCGAEAERGCDSWACTDCGIYWPPEGGPGALIDDSRPVCGAECQPFAASKMRLTLEDTYRCIRGRDHDGEHHGLLVDKERTDKERIYVYTWFTSWFTS